jgi:hypothetical protein
MGKLTLFEAKNVSKAVEQKAGALARLEAPPKMGFEVELDVSDSAAFKEIKDDDLLIEAMHKAAKAVYDDFVADMAEELKDADRLAGLKADEEVKGIVKMLDQGFKAQRSKYETKAEAEVERVWKGFLKTRSSYTKYKIKIGTNIALGVAGIAVSIGLLAGSPWTGGASAGLAIVGIFKSVASTAKEVVNLRLKVEEAVEACRVQADLFKKFASDAHAQLNKKGLANEAAAVIVKQFLGFSQPCVKQCADALNTATNKVDGIDVRAHDMSRELNKLLDEIEKLKAGYLAEARKMMAQHPLKDAEAAKIAKNLDVYTAPRARDVTAMIEDVEKLVVRVRANRAAVEDLEGWVKSMEKSRGTGLVVAENVLSLADIPLGLLSGNALASLPDRVVNCSAAAAAFTADKINNAALSGTILA